MSDKHSKVDQAYVKANFHYCPETGEFTHLATRYRGQQAGSFHRLGYRVIGMKQSIFYAHRIAWLYMYGEWPQGELDHISGDRADNRISNLRIVTRQENMQNIRSKSKRKNSTSKLLGVSFEQRMKTRPWRAVVYLNGKNHCCGYWPTEEEAHAAYILKKRQLHPGATL